MHIRTSHIMMTATHNAYAMSHIPMHMLDMQPPIVLHDPYTAHIAQEEFGHVGMDTDKYPKILWDAFPDQLPKMFVKHQQKLDGRDVVLIAAIRDCANGFRVAMMLRHLGECNPKSLALIVPSDMYDVDHPYMQGMVTTTHAIGIIEDSMRKAQGVPYSIYVREKCTHQMMRVDNTHDVHKTDAFVSGNAQYARQPPIVLHDPFTAHIANVFRPTDVESSTYPKILWDAHPDQLPKMVVKNQQQLEGRDVILVASMWGCANAFRVAMMLRHLGECHPKSLTLIVTAYLYGTDDRPDTLGTVVTAKHAIGIIEDGMRKAHGVPQRVFVLEPHTLQLLSIYQGSMHRFDVMPMMLNTVLAQHNKLGHKGSLCVVMPDNGADKRYGSIVKEMAGLCKVVCNKTREVGGTVKTSIAEDHRDVADRPSGYVIIDDIIRSGGTLIQCYNAIRCLAGPDVTISVAVVHADFVNNAIEAISASGINLFYITDSNRNASDKVIGNSKFMVLPCAAAIEL